MSPDTSFLVVVVVLALAFAYTNGFHDAPTSIATAISTRALTPRVAVVMAASMNVIGAFLGEGVARTIGRHIISAPQGNQGLAVLAAALVGAVAWNVLTWYKGMPSSASHALVGGMLGAALASATTVDWPGVARTFALPMLLAPVVGYVLGFLLMLSMLWAFRNRGPQVLSRKFKVAQCVSASAMALGNGLQDAQKTMGVIVLALIATGSQDNYDVPTWAVILAAIAMSLGTASGGWRIMRTLGRRVIQMGPSRGFAAEATVAAITYATSFIWNVPMSSTHTVTSAIVGVGAAERLRAVRWGMAGNIVVVWLFTLPGAAMVAAISYWMLWPLL
ncbi:inorganic phosphate transporter [Salinactinospora qingdaonensis]|uniref:Low-affinity phosphate transporter PitH n=1 Tax=Salinactinospora qingdaonensis TaxID=702744 RepID=A0ABP7F7Y9_9ACTN